MDETAMREAPVSPGELHGEPLAELADAWEHYAGFQDGAGRQLPTRAALAWLAAGEAIAERVFMRRGEAAALALMMGATLDEIATALGFPAGQLPERVRVRAARDVLIGWARDSRDSGQLAVSEYDAVMARLAGATI